MKNHFPFTDYDFYAYLTSGGLLLVIVDYLYNNAAVIKQAEWTFIQVVLAVGAAYILGHLVAMFAQIFLENFVANKIIAKPMQLQLRMKKANWLERMFGILVGRYYSALPEQTCQSIIEETAKANNVKFEEIADCETVFLHGFQRSFERENIRIRIDDFRNQYGLCRNVSFVALTGAFLFGIKAIVSCSWDIGLVGAILLLLSIGFFVRFLKFLASFQSEVIRSVTNKKP